MMVFCLGQRDDLESSKREDGAHHRELASSTTFCLVSSVFCSSILADTKPMFSTCQ